VVSHDKKRFDSQLRLAWNPLVLICFPVREEKRREEETRRREEEHS
jgi:hypothetical protein